MIEKHQPDHHPGADCNPDPDPDPEPDSVSEPDPEPKPDPGPDSKSDSGSDSKSDLGPDSKSDLGPEPDFAPDSVPAGGVPAILLAGGRPRDPAIMSRIMSAAFSGIDKPVVSYIGTANGDNPSFFEMMASTLRQAGAYKVLFLRLATETVNIKTIKDKLTASDVIFLSGGEVEDGIYWLERHGLVEFLRNLYSGGKRFLGVSAGTIMMGTYWTHWDVLEDDSTASLFECLGIIPRLFDVHGEDEGWTELKTTLRLLGDGATGYALPAGCAITADGSGVLVDIEKKPLVFVNKNGTILTRDDQ